MYTIKTAKKAIKEGIKAYLLKDDMGNYRMREVNCLPFYLEGAPGIGKTEIVKQITEELGIGYVSFSLVHHTRNTLLGLPVIREMEDGDRYTSFTMSEIIAKVLEAKNKGYEEGVLLLDEFPCMSESILPAMLAFLQTKNIGTHELPRGWVLVLCGNPAMYNKATHTFDAAITDRIRKIEVEYSADDFLEYGKEITLQSCILNYVDMHRDHAYRFSKQKNQEELVTCRGWENLSHALECAEILGQYVDVDFVKQFIKSEAVAADFTEYYKQSRSGISEEDVKAILGGRETGRLNDLFGKLSQMEQWNSTSYVLHYVQNNAQKCEVRTQMINYAKNFMRLAKKQLESKAGNSAGGFSTYNPFGEVAIFEHLLTELDADGVIRYWKNINELSPFFNGMSEDGETLAEGVFEKMVESWMDYCRSKSQQFVRIGSESLEVEKKIGKELTTWVKDMEKLLEKEQEKVSEQLANLFTFMAAQEGEEKMLSDKLYYAVSASPELLKCVCTKECKPYVEMCKAQYDIRTAS